MIIYLDTNDKRLAFTKEYLNKKNINTNDLDFCKLSDCNKNSIIVTSPSFKWTKETLEKLPIEVALLSGAINDEFKNIINDKNIKYINIMKNNTFVLKNAQLTAEGVLANLISHTNESIFSLKILIVGGGRVASAIGEIFKNLKLNFNYVTKDNNEFATLNQKSNNCLNWTNLASLLQQYDVVINTVPSQIFTKDIFIFKPNATVLEIASTNCLDVNDYNNINYILCPSLPTKFTPKSAGILIAEEILDLIKGDKI